MIRPRLWCDVALEYLSIAWLWFPPAAPRNSTVQLVFWSSNVFVPRRMVFKCNGNPAHSEPQPFESSVWHMTYILPIAFIYWAHEPCTNLVGNILAPNVYLTLFLLALLSPLQQGPEQWRDIWQSVLFCSSTCYPRLTAMRGIWKRGLELQHKHHPSTILPGGSQQGDMEPQDGHNPE